MCHPSNLGFVGWWVIKREVDDFSIDKIQAKYMMTYLWFDSVETVIQHIEEHSIKYPKKEYIIILKG